MKTIEDARPVFFALGQKTLARFVSCGVAVTRTRWKILLRCASQQSSFFVLLASSFLLFVEAGEVSVLFGMGFLQTQSKSSLPLAVWSRCLC